MLSEELSRLEVQLAQVAARKGGDAGAGAGVLPEAAAELDAFAARVQERATECATCLSGGADLAALCACECMRA